MPSGRRVGRQLLGDGASPTEPGYPQMVDRRCADVSRSEYTRFLSALSGGFMVGWRGML
jgi:hypothetical protein